MTAERPTQFSLRVSFHFAEHAAHRQRWFGVGDDRSRRIPLEMEGIDGLNTVSMRFRDPGRFMPGDIVTVECTVIAPGLFLGKLAVGSRGRLWDGGYFADVEVVGVDDRALLDAHRSGEGR